MNVDTALGEGTEMKGKLKEGLGNATGDTALQRDGAADQMSGQMRQAFGALRDFVREQPFAAASIAGVIGLALLQGTRRSSHGRTRS
jgi:uncharacterized protein YjbJ (UPF0337 family)